MVQSCLGDDGLGSSLFAGKSRMKLDGYVRSIYSYIVLERKEEFHPFVVSEIAFRLSLISEKIKGAEVFIDPNTLW